MKTPNWSLGCLFTLVLIYGLQNMVSISPPPIHPPITHPQVADANVVVTVKVQRGLEVVTTTTTLVVAGDAMDFKLLIERYVDGARITHTCV